MVDRVVKIKRCAAVVKGGRRFSFAAMVVVGDTKGKIGFGYGKANEVPPSVQKAQKAATNSMIEIPIVNGTIPHQVVGTYGAAKVILIPAGAGTGIIAGEAVRAVCEASGIHDILTKSFGTNNAVTLVKATVNALSRLRTVEQVAALRGLSVEELSQ
jgi:small subunit ribosomal protein S5